MLEDSQLSFDDFYQILLMIYWVILLANPCSQRLPVFTQGNSLAYCVLLRFSFFCLDIFSFIYFSLILSYSIEFYLVLW